MSAEEKQDELKSFEAALAALLPRTDRLDRERLMFLAGQQSISASHGHITAGQFSSGTQGKRTWAWPAAFSVMSAVAATLFMMLLLRPGPGLQTTEGVAKQAASDASLTGYALESTDAGKYADQSYGNRSILSLAALSGIDIRKLNENDSTYSYTQLLNQIIDKGVDSWEPRATGPYTKKAITTRPLTSRELMNQLLDQIGSGSS
jgi:hypothetical protein